MAEHELQGHTSDHTAVAEGHAHPKARLYIEIAVILAIITAVEVFVLYLPNMGFEGLRPALVPIFALLSIAKFVMVVGWYMHLKFDDPFFVRIFGFALLIAFTVATAFIALFHGIYFG